MADGSMPLDYKKLGFKAGLEVHQQLNTGKLFCRCPSLLREDEPDIRFERQLKVVASEFGEFDRAAVEAAAKNLLYTYEAYSDTNCLVEADEEPPKRADREAVKTAIQVALLVNARIFDEIFVMRKLVLDGSAISSFQRTMLVAAGGALEIGNGRRLGIQSIALEEDAAKIIQKTEEGITYRLDRLGIPLIELATAPELRTPEEVKAAARAIGALFRNTGRAKRGLGTIRQDINISIREGARVEIKGVQELELIDEYAGRETLRQIKLLGIRGKLRERNLRKEDLGKEPADISMVFRQTKCGFISAKMKEGGNAVLGARLEKFGGILGEELMPDYRFGTELASYVRAKTGLKGIMHSDELPGHGISAEEKAAVNEALGCGEGDAFVFVCGKGEKAERAISAVLERCAQALAGVPEETRNALPNGNTEYLRPLPGAARMYPETDLEPIRVPESSIREIRKNLPLSPEERKELYVKKFRLSEKLAEEMKLSNYAGLFEELVKKRHDPKKTAVLLLEDMTRLRRDGIGTDAISADMVEAVLGEFRKGGIQKGVIADVLGKWAGMREKNLAEVIAEMGYGREKGSADETRKKIIQVIERNLVMVRENGMHAMGALMGDVMKELKGTVSGEEASRILKEELGKRLGS